MPVQSVDILEVTDGEDTLAGATEGANALAKLISRVAEVSDTSVVLLDFRNVTIATSSFLREAVLGFRDYCRNSRPNLYPVISNANLKVREELDGLLRLKGDALVLCETNPKGNIATAVVVGKLEDKQRLTLRAVLKAGRTDAVSLSRQDRDGKLGPTAWNNRLTSLSAKGILRESQTGRVKVYEPVVEALSYGH